MTWRCKLEPDQAMGFYIQEVPKTDGWGHDFEYRYGDSVLGATYMSIRSPGRDGKYSGSTYDMGPFDAEDYDEDIVWSDGFFVRYPAGVTSQRN